MERTTLEYEDLSQKYASQVAQYSKQYCNIYLIRLKQMTKVLEKRIQEKWGDKYPVCKLHRLSEDGHDGKNIVIGTLFKNQKLKPSILKELAESNSLTPQPIVTHFTDESDQLHIEDELQRYEIVGTLNCEALVTGITCALLVSSVSKGKIFIEDCVYAGLQNQIERPLVNDSLFIVFMSGLDLIHHEKIALNLQLFTLWLCNYFGEKSEVSGSKIVRVILAGNNVRSEATKFKHSVSILSRKPEPEDTIEAVRRLDQFLLILSKLLDVDVMPGENDPTNHILPQKPLHRCMFTNAFKLKSLNLVTNPYYCSVNGATKILGTCGQNIQDILRYSDIKEPLEAMERCLEWGHIAPTAPDTLGCFPFTEEDPFILEECPHVFFAGNQEKFNTKEVAGNDGQRIRLICIPQFHKTQEVALLNLRTLECLPMQFKAV